MKHIASLLLLLLSLTAVCWAGRVFNVYKDPLCADKFVSYYWTTDACPVKRSVQNECLQIDATDYYYLPDCQQTPTTTPGWTTFTLYKSSTTCSNLSYDLYSVVRTNESIPVVIWNVNNKIFATVNVTCDQGMNVQRCSSGCSNEALAYNTCTAFDGYSGNQTSCVGSPTPIASPMAMPSSSPSATTPAKKSSSASVAAFSGFVMLAGLFAF